MKIKDLVRLNREGSFATAIDLMDFRVPASNAELCASFCFAKLDKKPVFGSWDWMKMIGYGLASGQKNIWSLTANYGHGKTHFGVVLANFFGQPWGAPELNKIEELLACVSSPEHAKQILAWRKSHPKPYLALCLQGHQMPNLKQAVLQEVERELRRHEATKDYSAPLWQGKALEWLDRMSEPERQAAESWLNKRGRDIDDVRKSLVERDSRTEFKRVIDDLSAAIASDGIPKHFGYETTVRKLLDEIYAEHCGEGKPFSGIAVIFDEFHVFVDTVAKRPDAGDTLQDLFEAILTKERRNNGSAFLIALGTMDPTEAARRAIGELPPDNPLEKQLNRIPREHRYELRSEIEAVLDGLLDQQWDRWEVFETQVAEPLKNATFVTYETFQGRLRGELGYDLDGVRTKVTIGSFPLHPITTMLLSNIDFDVVENPRGVLEFVKDQFDRMGDQDALRGGRPNWIVANELYEPFFPMFKANLRDRVEVARESIGGDITEEHDWVLRAITLISAGKLPTPGAARGGYARLVSEIADMGLEAAQKTLDDLVDRGVIELERVSGAYKFFSGANRAQFEGALRTARGKVRLDLKSIDELTTLVTAAAPEFVRAKPAPVDWGSSIDWKFERKVAMRAQLEAGLLAKLPRFADVLTAVGTKDWTRAVEVVFLPQSPEDIEWIRREGPSLLQEAYPGMEVPPVVIVTATEVASAVEAATVDMAAVDLVSSDDRTKLVQGGQWATGVDQVRQRLKQAIDHYSREKTVRIVAPSLKSTLENLAEKNEQGLHAGLLTKVYTKGPAKFTTNYSLSQHAFTGGCAKLGNALLSKSVAALKSTDPNGPAMTVAENILQNEWSMLDSQYQLRSPTDARVLNLWAGLHEEFPAGSLRSLGPVLQRFARPPYGLDTCSMCLIVCGWLGSLGREVQINLDNVQVGFGKLCPDSNIRTLLGNLLRVKLKREDVGELNERAQKIIQQIESKSELFTRAEAVETIRALEAFQKDPLEGWETRVSGAIDALQTDLEAARKYASLVEGVAQPSGEPSKLLDYLESAGKTVPGQVNEGWPSPADLRSTLTLKLENLWEKVGSPFAEIKDLTVYEQRKEKLLILQNKALRIGASAFENMVRETVAQLDIRKKHLEAVAEQKEFMGELRGFQPKHQTLMDLRAAKKDLLAKASSLSPLAPEVNDRYTAKLAEMDTEIEKLCDPEAGIEAALSEASNWRSLQTLHTQLERLSDRLAGTSELSGVERIRERAEKLIELMTSMAALEKNPPEARAKLIKKIDEIQIQADNQAAPPAVRQVAERVVASLRKAETDRIRKADRDFDVNEKAIDSRSTKIRDLERLHEFFSAPPEYVSDNARLRAPLLVARVDERLVARSADHIRTIASRLKGDPATLLELANYLKSLAEEKCEVTS
jgi:hypothetical protein